MVICTRNFQPGLVLFFECYRFFRLTALRSAICLSLLFVLAACSSSDLNEPAPPPAAPMLAADTLVFNGAMTGNMEIYQIGVGETDATALTSDSRYDSWWPRVSPDREQVLFYRTPAGTGDDYAQTALWVMSADGSNARELIPRGTHGWTIQGHAEWSPDGQQLVMCGTADSAVHVFTTDANGQNPVQQTLDGTWNCDPAWSPDGAAIVFNRCTTPGPCGDPNVKADLEIFLMPASTTGNNAAQMTRLTTNNRADYDAYFSPDGSTIAWLQLVDPSGWGGVGTWSVFAMDPGGANQRAVIDDGFINSKPAWSLDGRQIYLHRLGPGSTGNWELFSVAPDGTNLQRINPVVPANLEYPSN